MPDCIVSLYIYKHGIFYRRRSLHVLRSLHFVRPLSFQLFANSMLFVVYFGYFALDLSLFHSFPLILSLCLPYTHTHTLSFLLLLLFIICFISFGYWITIVAKLFTIRTQYVYIYILQIDAIFIAWIGQKKLENRELNRLCMCNMFAVCGFSTQHFDLWP